MDKNIVALVVMAVLGFGVLGYGLANQSPPVVNVAGPVVNLPPSSINVSSPDVNVPSLGGFETGKITFSGLSEGVLQSARVFISSVSFGNLNTSQVLLLASSSDAGGTAGAKINQFLGATIESNPSSEGYDNFRGFNVYVKNNAVANIIASASPFVALGSGSNQRVQVIQTSVCQNTTGVAYVCPDAGAFRNAASSSAFYLKQTIEQNPTIRTQGDTSFWVTVYYRVYDTLSGF